MMIVDRDSGYCNIQLSLLEVFTREYDFTLQS